MGAFDPVVSASQFFDAYKGKAGLSLDPTNKVGYQIAGKNEAGQTLAADVVRFTKTELNRFDLNGDGKLTYDEFRPLSEYHGAVPIPTSRISSPDLDRLRAQVEGVPADPTSSGNHAKGGLLGGLAKVAMIGVAAAINPLLGIAAFAGLALHERAQSQQPAYSDPALDPIDQQLERAAPTAEDDRQSRQMFDAISGGDGEINLAELTAFHVFQDQKDDGSSGDGNVTYDERMATARMLFDPNGAQTATNTMKQIVSDGFIQRKISELGL